MTNKRSLAGALACMVLFGGGCEHLSRYERPELFHPQSAIEKHELKAAAAPAQKDAAAQSPVSGPTPASTPAVAASILEIEVPRAGMLRGQNYAIRVNDDCPEGSAPEIIVDPPGVIQKQATRSGRWTTVVLNIPTPTAGTMDPYANVHSIEVSALSCRATLMSLADAEKGERYRTVSIRVGRLGSVSSTLNVWSQEDTADEFGIEFANNFIAADVVFTNDNASPILIYGSTLTARVRFLAAKQDVRKVFGDAAVDRPELLAARAAGSQSYTALDYLNFKEQYRPMSFSDILAIFTYQKESDPRKRLIETLKAMGEIATGAAIFGIGQDAIEGIAFFTGVVNPEAEKLLLWDVLLHVKNLEERSLKEVEEIPQQGQLRRVVFFPRRPILGILPNMPVYIAELRPDEVSVTAAVIRKEGTVKSTGK